MNTNELKKSINNYLSKNRINDREFAEFKTHKSARIYSLLHKTSARCENSIYILGETKLCFENIKKNDE